ncbi:MAG: methionine gamma-lyase family protein, partial [Oscillospiraceae bacterium]|nr:methionine gamma-lyase family protein [Candidatus Equicaccousia limihippi]
EKLTENRYAAAYIQRSRGYSLRRSLTADEVTAIYNKVKEISPDTAVLVDNCYGIFTDTKEPQADLLMGSLIKNAGGGIAPCGGYLAGTKAAVEKCSYRLTAPGVGREIGATLSHNRELYMGLFAAPQTVAAALKTAVYTACLFEDAGFGVLPKFDAVRGDIVQTVLLENAENLIEFCRGIQEGSPVDSAALPCPAPMPGYDDQIIMAAGAFTGGSSIELSADGPLREPFAVYMQGGLNFDCGRYGVLHAAQRVFGRKE